MPRRYTKDKVPPAHLYTRAYQRRLGILSRPPAKRKLPDDATLAGLVKELSVKQIATVYGVTRQAVYGRLKRAGIEKERYVII